MLSPKYYTTKKKILFFRVVVVFLPTSSWINKYFLLVRCHLHLNTRTYLPPTVTHAIKNGVSEWEEKKFLFANKESWIVNAYNIQAIWLEYIYKIKIRCLECDLFRSVLDYLGSNLNICLSYWSSSEGKTIMNWCLIITIWITYYIQWYVINIQDNDTSLTALSTALYIKDEITESINR